MLNNSLSGAVFSVRPPDLRIVLHQGIRWEDKINRRFPLRAFVLLKAARPSAATG
jgi:hypothetical protein